MNQVFILIISYACGVTKTIADTNWPRIRDYFDHYRAMGMGELITVPAPASWDAMGHEARENFAALEVVKYRQLHQSEPSALIESAA